MRNQPWEERELALDRVEEQLDPLLRRAGDDRSSSHDLVLDAEPQALLNALFDAGLLAVSPHVITLTAGGWRLDVDYLHGWSCSCGEAGKGGHTQVIGAVRDAIAHVRADQAFSVSRPYPPEPS